MTQPPPPDNRHQAAADGAAIAPLVAAQAAARAALTAQAIALVTAAAQSFRGWYDTDQITAWAARLAAQIEALQRAQASTTDAYLARALSQITGGRVRPAGRIDVSDLRDGITHAGAYARAADAYRWQQSQLDAFAKKLVEATAAELEAMRPPKLALPFDVAASRVAAVADMDMQMADRSQSNATLQRHADNLGIRGYRRVIHPERSKGGTCGLCIAASDRIYHLEELRPIHARCECTTLPIIGAQDPGSGLNGIDLGTLYTHAGSTSAADLKRTRYQVNEHGELGPVLTDGTFRNRREVKRDEKKPRTAKTAAQKMAAVVQIRDRIDAALPRARDLAKADPKQWNRYLHDLERRLHDLNVQIAA